MVARLSVIILFVVSSALGFQLVAPRHRSFKRGRLPLLRTPSLAPAARRKLDTEFVQIAAPAFAQFAAEPLARLVDTAYLGRLGPAALGGAGAAIAAQYAVAKLYNDPLLRSTISIVAGKEGCGADARADAAALALLLALVVGVMQGLFFAAFAGPILTAGCVGPASEMRPAAMGYLRVCALGAPTTTIWLVANGIFRGLGDTATPLVWALAFTSLNAVLDGVFIFPFRMGAAGAAAGTALAQTLALLPLLAALHRKLQRARREEAAVAGVPYVRGGLFRPAGGLDAARAGLLQYIRAGGLVLLRTIGKISAYSVCAREAARLGPVASAAHNLCFQLGVATTQLCESIAIATQTLLARELGWVRVQAGGDTSVGETSGPIGAGPETSAGADPGDRGAADAGAGAGVDGGGPTGVSGRPSAQPAAVRHVLRRGVVLATSASASLALLTFCNRRSVVHGERACDAETLAAFPTKFARACRSYSHLPVLSAPTPCLLRRSATDAAVQSSLRTHTACPCCRADHEPRSSRGGRWCVTIRAGMSGPERASLPIERGADGRSRLELQRSLDVGRTDRLPR
jgi:putative MATE family efflux protein